MPVEVTDLATLVRRGGRGEFAGPQRPTFDIVLHVLSGSTIHEVDFTVHPLATGDVVWVRAGQVQRWGDVTAIDARVVLIAAELIDSATATLTNSRLGARHRSVWPAVATGSAPFAQTLEHFTAATRRIRGTFPDAPDVREQALAHAVQGMLIELAGSAPEGSAAPNTRNEILEWLETEIERSYRVHRSANWYADRLGYSARTLNRVAVAGTGLTAKELIDARVALEAKRLLVHDPRSIIDIAGTLGFDDAANFTAYFRRLVGTTPHEFRRRQAGNR